HEIIQSAQRSIELLEQTEKELVDKTRLSRLEEFVSSQYGRSAVSVLADVDAGKLVYSLGPQSSQVKKNSSLPSGTAPLNRQLIAPPFNSKDRQSGGSEKKPPHPGMPPASSSMHPIINGSKPHNPAVDGLLCINCGDFGHRRRECKNPPLPYWEQAYLKEIVFKPISSQSAQSYFYQMLFEDEITYTQDEPQSSREASCFSVDLRVVGTKENPTISDNSKLPLLKDNSSKTPLTFESTEQEDDRIIDLSALIAESAENSRKRARIEDILNDEHDFQTKPRKSGRAKKGESRIRELREIVGRRGKGPVDYRKLAEEIKVPINLLDLFQISPDLVKNFK
ncbi:hypothetical protein K3495_g16121, partial [Podosphaera aphanis]